MFSKLFYILSRIYWGEDHSAFFLARMIKDGINNKGSGEYKVITINALREKGNRYLCNMEVWFPSKNHKAILRFRVDVDKWGNNSPQYDIEVHESKL